MFRRIALRLTLTNVVVLAGIVVVALVATYIGVRTALERNSARQLHDTAEAIAASVNPRAFGLPSFASISVYPPGETDNDQNAVDGQIALATALWFTFDQNGTMRAETSAAAQGNITPDQGAVATALTGSSVSGALHPHDGYLRTLTLPVYSGAQIVGALQIAESWDTEQRLLGSLVTILVVIGVGGIAVAGGLGWWLTTRSLIPVREAFGRQRAFISDASHELRTPAAIIRADADALSRTLSDLPAEDAELLMDLQQESGYLGEVITRLLETARFDDRFEAPTLEPVDLTDLADESAKAVEHLASESEVTVTVADAPDPLIARADPIRLRLVVLTLLDNAIKYNRPGGAVRVSATRRGDSAVIEIADTGIGIAKEDLQRVFDRFYRVDKARSRAQGGVGLGLTIARGAVESLGGRLELESVEGVGTTARVVLPTKGPKVTGAAAA